MMRLKMQRRKGIGFELSLILVLLLWAANGLSRVVPGCRKTGPAGLRWLLKSPPRHAGPAPTPLRASRFNPCRHTTPKTLQFQLIQAIKRPALRIDTESPQAGCWAGPSRGGDHREPPQAGFRPHRLPRTCSESRASAQKLQILSPLKGTVRKPQPIRQFRRIYRVYSPLQFHEPGRATVQSHGQQTGIGGLHTPCQQGSQHSR